MFDKIIEKKRLTEAEAKVYFFQGQYKWYFNELRVASILDAVASN